MHVALKDLLDRTVHLFEQDPRCLAAYHFGSIGTADEDVYSDVDPVFIISPEHFRQVDAELPKIFRGFCPLIHLWWPESGNCDTWRNYAVLFEVNGEVLQYDMTIMTPPPDTPVRVPPEQFLFDKAGLIQVARAPERPTYSPIRLMWHIERFWVYAYIHAKYLLRSDPFRLAFAQQELFRDHLAVLCAVSSQAEAGWWPHTVKHVVPPHRKPDLLLYFGKPDREAVGKALQAEMNAFSQDAREACRRWSLEYPESLEHVIRRHLARACGDTYGAGSPG